MKNPDKKIPELTKNDLIDVGVEVSLSQKVLQTRIRDYLGIPVEEVIGISVELSPYERFIQTVVFEEFLTEQKYKITAKLQISDCEYITPFEYTSIEVGPGETRQAIGEGYVFLESGAEKKVRFVMLFEERGYGSYKLLVITRSEHAEAARELLKGLSEYAESHNILKNKKITPSFAYLKLNPQYTWDTVILPEATKKEIRQNVELLINSIDVYKKNNMTFKRGLILKGIPGTGKTLIGKILCNSINNATFLWVTPGDLNEVRKVKSVCEVARSLAPTILFLEDIDLYGGHRHQENRSILGEFMNQLDGLVENEFVVVIATTNHPDDLENAIRNRPGRFDRLIEVPIPDKECRVQMLELFISSNPALEVKDKRKLIEALAERTEDFTGAHMKELINSAIIQALDEKSLTKEGRIILKRKHFSENIKIVKEKEIVAGFSKMSPQGKRPSILDDDD